MKELIKLANAGYVVKLGRELSVSSLYVVTVEGVDMQYCADNLEDAIKGAFEDLICQDEE